MMAKNSKLLERIKAAGYFGLIVILFVFLSQTSHHLNQSGYGEPCPVYESIQALRPEEAYLPYDNDEVPKATRLCTAQERVQHLRSYCDYKFGEPFANLASADPKKFTSTAVFVSDSRKLMWCEVSKAGCTTLQNVLQKINGTQVWSGLAQRIEMLHRYTNYTKFTNIRHPFDRVLSAYYNTIRKKPTDLRGPDYDIVQYITRFSKRNSTSNLTFTDFVRFLVSDPHRHPARMFYDRHWDSYGRSCKVCQVLFDIIIRIETVDIDAEPILPLFGYKKDYLAVKTIANQSPRKYNSTAISIDSQDNEKPLFTYSKALPEYSVLDNSLLKKLYKRYQLDFEAFGYNFDLRQNIASCGIRLSSGDVCC